MYLLPVSSLDYREPPQLPACLAARRELLRSSLRVLDEEKIK